MAYAWTTLHGRLIAAEKADERFYAASTMKLGVLIEVYRHIESGACRPDQLIEIVDHFPSAYDGEPYRLDPDDLDVELGRQAALHAGRLPLAHLVEQMITVSSNDATNLLLGLVGLAQVQATLVELGLTRTCIQRGIGDARAQANGLSNLVTPRDLCHLLTGIATGRAASAASCAEMLAVLSRQRYREEIPAGVPPGVPTANKNGWVPGLRHDAALIWPPDSPGYALAVCTRGFADDEAARAAIQQVSRTCYARRGLLADPAGGEALTAGAAPTGCIPTPPPPVQLWRES